MTRRRCIIDGLARAGAGSTIIEITDEASPVKGTWILPGLSAKDLATIENFLLQNRIDPIDAVMDGVKKLREAGIHTEANQLFRMAYKDLRKSKATNKISQVDLFEYIESLEGSRFTIFLSLQKQYPDMTREKSDLIFDARGEAEMKRLRDKASGLDRLGNSTGPMVSNDTPEGTTEAKAVDSPDESTAPKLGRSPGVKSTGTSPPSTVSARPLSAK